MTKARTAGYQTWQHSRRNKLVNSDFKISQMNDLSSPFTMGAAYVVDQWHWNTVGPSVFTAAHSGNMPPDGDTTGGTSMQLDCTTQEVSLAASSYVAFSQRLEGNRLDDLNLGINTATNMTLSFWVQSNLTGTYCVSFGQGGGTLFYIAEYTIDVADTWEYKTITVPTPDSGTWNTGVDYTLLIRLVVGAGTDHHGTADSWQSGGKVSTANQVNLAASTSNYVRFAYVQLEAGDYATDYEQLSIAENLRECQRYYFKTYDQDVVPGALDGSGLAVMNTNAGGNIKLTIPFPSKMRASPTVTSYSYITGVSGKWTDGALDFNATTIVSGEGRVVMGNSTGPGGNAVAYFHVTASAQY